MDRNQDEKVSIKRRQNFELPIRKRMKSDQNETSIVHPTEQTASSKSKLSPTAPEFASSARQEPTPEASKARLSGSASAFIPDDHVPSLVNDPVSSNGASPQTSDGSHGGQRLVAGPCTRGSGFRNGDRVRYEQTAEYHGLHPKDKSPQDTSQAGILPLLDPLPYSESPPVSSISGGTNNTGDPDVVVPSSADQDWFLPAAPVETTRGSFTSVDEILNAMGNSNDLSIPKASYQMEEYHKQPHAPSLTRILQLANEDRENRDDRFKALQKREEYFKAQISCLTTTIESLRKREEQATSLSAEVDDLKQQLSATQDHIQQIRNEQAESDLKIALDRLEKLKAEKERVQRRHDWYLNRAKTLQFVENADLKDRNLQLEDQVKDLTLYPERLKESHQERIKSLESSLKAVAEDRGELQKMLANAGSQRDKALQEVAGGLGSHGILPVSVHDHQMVEKFLKEIASLRENIASLQIYQLDASKLMFENKDLREENSILQSDREKFCGQVGRLQRDRTGARRAFHELEKKDASLKALEEEKVVWKAKETGYIKQRDEEVFKLAAERKKFQNQVEELQKKLKEKAWEAEKAQNELEKYKTQRIDDALSKENLRGREIDRDGEAPTTPPTSQSTRSSSEESRASRTPCNPPKPPTRKICLDPTGREDYL